MMNMAPPQQGQGGRWSEVSPTAGSSGAGMGLAPPFLRAMEISPAISPRG